MPTPHADLYKPLSLFVFIPLKLAQNDTQAMNSTPSVSIWITVNDVV